MEDNRQPEPMISVSDITKIYRLYEKPIDRLKESVSLSHRSYHRDFYALRNVSFKVDKGEAVGIIGTNGSGKSTILKIITGVLSPSAGELKTRGTVCALLELGAGFNQDYTGIENIYMNGTMMGFSREEMDSRLQDILDFADIGEFVYQPVKSYSSGMFVRLAFALYISVDPDVLIVDEALSVGDVFFQAKCYRRMDELKRRGTTILMVTHDLGSVMKYCDRVVLLNRGEKVSEGRPGEMVDLYKKILAGQYGEEPEDGQDFAGEHLEDACRDGISESGADTCHNPGELMQSRLPLNPNVQHYGDGRAEIYDIGILDGRGRLSNVLLKGEEFSIVERIRFHDKVESPIFTFTIKDKRGMDLSGTNTMFEGQDIPAVKQGDEYTCTFRQRMNLQGGEYLLSVSCTGFEQGEHTVYDRKYDILSLTVLSNKNTVGIYDMESELSLERHEA